jgi:hypothetical protein
MYGYKFFIYYIVPFRSEKMRLSDFVKITVKLSDKRNVLINNSMNN